MAIEREFLERELANLMEQRNKLYEAYLQAHGACDVINQLVEYMKKSDKVEKDPCQET